MNAMIGQGLAVAIGLSLGLALPAQAAVTGQCRYEDHTLVLVDGAAWLPPAEEIDEEWLIDEDGDGEPDLPPPPVALGFASFVIDHAALDRAKDREDALSDQNWDQDGDAGRIVVTLAGGEVESIMAFFPPGTTLSRSGGELGTVAPAPSADGKGPVAGKWSFSDDDDAFSCDVAFSVPRLGDPKDAPPPPGKPLPAGGGEPGQAYLALNQALRTGDLDALAAMLPPDQAAEMQAQRDAPDFAAQLALMKTMAPTDIVITGGRIDGDQALVEFTAVEFGTPRVGTAQMRRVGGKWTLEKESTRDPD